MTELALYYSPITCAKVTLICLEEIGAPFELKLMRLARGEHKDPAFKGLNPSGKVPVLVVDGQPLSETVAIITLLNTLFPDAGLLPFAPDAIAAAGHLSDLSFCAANLHPFVTRICVPMAVAPPEAQVAVQHQAARAVEEFLQIVEDRLAQSPWWYDDQWSAMDPYLYWVYWRLDSVGYDFSNFPAYSAHAKRMEARAATLRAAAHDQAALATLEAESAGLRVEPIRPAPRPPASRRSRRSI